MDLAGDRFETYVAKGLGLAETLRDPGHSEERFGDGTSPAISEIERPAQRDVGEKRLRLEHAVGVVVLLDIVFGDQW